MVPVTDMAVIIFIRQDKSKGESEEQNVWSRDCRM